MTDVKKKVYVTSSFKRDYKNLSKRHTDLSSLNEVFEALLSNDRDVLDTKYRDHALVGQWKGFRELHVRKDVLLVYRVAGFSITVIAVRLSSHDELFSRLTTAKDIRNYLRETEELLRELEERNSSRFR